jgi:hypothetical protein
MEIIEIMDRKRRVEFPFETGDGVEIWVSGMLIDSPYESYFEIREASLVSDPTVFIDEEDFLEEDLERLAQEAEDFLINDSLYRTL